MHMTFSSAGHKDMIWSVFSLTRVSLLTGKEINGSVKKKKKGGGTKTIASNFILGLV